MQAARKKQLAWVHLWRPYKKSQTTKLTKTLNDALANLVEYEGERNSLAHD